MNQSDGSPVNSARYQDLLRALVAILGLALIGCGDGAEPSTDPHGDLQGVDALYAILSDERETFVPLANELMADPGPPPAEGGISEFRSAVQFAALAYDEQGVAGVRLLFAPEATPEQKGQWLDRARDLSSGDVEVLRSEDEWPNCRDEPDCTRVGDTLSLG